MGKLSGKYISIMGASTSTFDGISNDVNSNSTIGINAPYYPKAFLGDAADTWWMRTIDALDLKLCVNNSWSGSCVSTKTDGAEKAACMDRAFQLHNDVLGIEPDIIVLIIGGNDALRGYDVGEYSDAQDIYDAEKQTYIGDCALFSHAYATMVHKVKRRYPNAAVYACSMLHWQTRKHDKGVAQYNAAVEKIAKEFGVTYVDFYHETAICPETEGDYFHTDGVHPNKNGFAQMAECIVRTLRRL